MDQLIRYQFNERPRRGLAVAGIFLLKGVLAVPHLILINALGSLAWAAGYIGYWIVAFTGSLPMGLQGFIAWYLRWYARTIGWYTGVTDVYPPFEPEPEGYLPDVEPPRNQAPSKGWAVAGIFLPVKILAALPHLILLGVLAFAVAIGSWIGFLVVAFTGRLPIPFQDLYMGTTQWAVRVGSWILGLTDRYPPFDLEVHPVR